MTVPDAAVEAAAAELVRQETAGCCTLGKVCGLCDCFADRDNGAMRDGYARQHARAALDAALPVIREGIAQEIDERATYSDRGSEGLARVKAFASGLRTAARIVRGGTP